MHLTKIATKILKIANHSEPDLQERFYTIGNISRLTGLNNERVLASMQYLTDNKYVEYADKQQTCFRLLELGYSYKEVQMHQFLERWGDRVWAFVSGVAIGVMIANLGFVVDWMRKVFTVG